MKQPVIIGSDGQLARAFKAFMPDAVYLNRAAFDLAHPERVNDALAAYDPAVIFNTAAYTQVDNAEAEEKLATKINGDSPTALAIYCAAQKIPFVHFSTDYVFDGGGDAPHREEETPAPLNAYGRSKLAGEDGVTHVGGNYLIFRTSWVYDARGKNFMNTILRLAAEREELRVINDQFGAPTFAPQLAQSALTGLAMAATDDIFPSGIYHLCNQNFTTWYGFAVAIVEHAKRLGFPVKVKAIHPIPATDYPLPAKRPYNSRLDCSKARSILNIEMPTWEEGLAACMEEKRESQ